jgi:glycerate dehydrogenase
MNIVVLDGFTANPGDLTWKELESLGQVTVYERTCPSDTVFRLQDADIVLTNKVRIGKEEMAQLPRLKYIGVLATGYNVVDIEEAHQRNISVTNVPAYSTDSVAQMVFAHLLTVSNRPEHYALQNRKGAWTASKDFCYMDTPLIELTGKRMGIVGLGNIGMRVANIAHAFGMHVSALTSKTASELPTYIAKENLNQLFKQSDVISLHCPLTPATHHLVNEELLALMKPSAILINTGRGPLIDELAVADALKNKRIAAYCADVLEQEPPTTNNPLLNCPSAYITPHIAWATREARLRLIDIATDNIRAFMNGHPQNSI